MTINLGHVLRISTVIDKFKVSSEVVAYISQVRTKWIATRTNFRILTVYYYPLLDIDLSRIVELLWPTYTGRVNTNKIKCRVLLSAVWFVYPQSAHTTPSG